MRSLVLLQLRVRMLPALISFNTLIAALIALLPLDVIQLFRGGLYSEDVLFAGEILIVSAFCIAAVVQILYFGLRLAAAVILRAERIAVNVLPGAALFLFLQPYVDQLALAQLPAVHPLIVWAVTLIAGLLLSLPLLAVFPDFRGENSPIFIFAVVLSRLLMTLFERPDGPVSFVAEIGFEILLFAVLYLWLQMRRRLHRSPDYTPFFVPFSQRAALISVAAVLYASALALPLLEWQLDRAPILIVLCAALSWILSAHVLDARLESSESGNSPWLALLFAILSSAALLDLYVRFPAAAPSTAARLLSAEAVSGRLLLNAGSLLDEDMDGNSSWPALDPDDRDPCARKDGLNICRNPAPLDLPPPKYNRVLIVTASTRDRTGVPSFLPADDVLLSLRSMLRGVDGYSAAYRKPADPMLSTVSEYGFRTICVGVRAPELSPESGNGLDHGCQVVLSAQDIDAAIAAAEKYSRKKVLVWIHANNASSSEITAARSRMNSYRYAIVKMDVERQSVYFETKDFQAPFHIRSLLAKILADTEPPDEAVDIQIRSRIRAPALMKLGGRSPRFFNSIRYARKPDDKPYRQAFEGFSGAVWITEPGERPD